MTNTNSSYVAKCFEIFKKNRWTVGFAESCTGGALSSCFTDQEGISEVFMGAIVCYSSSIKEKLLNISHNALLKEGAVSETVVKQMAKGAVQTLTVDWSVAITGIAGPGGGSPDTPVGTVWFCIHGPDFEWTEKQIFSGNRQDVQSQSVSFALKQLHRVLEFRNKHFEQQ